MGPFQEGGLPMLELRSRFQQSLVLAIASQVSSLSVETGQVHSPELR